MAAREIPAVTAYFILTSPDGNTGLGMSNFVLYQSVEDANRATAAPAGALRKDVVNRRRYEVAAGQNGVGTYAEVASNLLNIASRISPGARAALAGGPLYNTPFSLPLLDDPEEVDSAYEALEQIRRIIGSADDLLYSSTLVLAVDLGDRVDEQEVDPELERQWQELLAKIDEEMGEAAQLEGAGSEPQGSVLSRYYLHGTPEVAAPAEQAEPAEQAAPVDPAEPRPVLRIPWAGFTPGPPVKCLIDGIIEKYSAEDIPLNRRLSRKTVEDYFTKTGPSLEALKSFAEKYRIPLRVYDISGAEIASLRVTVPSGSGARRGLGVMAYNGHAYFRDGSISEDLRLVAKADHDLDVFVDTRQLQPEAEGTMEASILLRFLDWAPVNKSWKAEKHLGARSLAYVAEGAALTAGAVGWDMKKAFHTAVKKDFRGVGIPIAQKIPAFTAVDDWVVAGAAPFPPRRLWNLTYFLVKVDVADSWAESGVPYLAARANNLLTGPEFEYLLAEKRVSVEDISGWKTATTGIYTGRYEHFTRIADGAILPERTKMKHATILLYEQEGRPRTIPGEVAQSRLDRGELEMGDIEGWSTESRSFGAFLDELDGEGPGAPEDELGGLTRSQFAMYHGLFGRTESRTHTLMVSADSLDTELLGVAHSSVKPGSRGDVSTANVELSRSRELLMNTRTTYDYIVASTNLVMMRVIDDITKTHPEAVLLRVQTDAIVYDRPIELPIWAISIFHTETPRLGCRARRKVAVQDPQLLRERIAKEVDEVAAKVVGYVGAPGTGKTHAVKTHHEYDEAMAFSNITARNLDGRTESGAEIRGRTLDEALRLQAPSELSAVCGRARGRTWWIDEISTIRASVWSVIVEVASRGLERLILTGDPNQIPPIDEKFRNDSLLIRAILDRAQRLTKDYRNDAGLVTVRERVMALQSPTAVVDPHTFVKTIHADFPAMSPAGRQEEISAADVHITHTRAATDMINKWIAQTRGLKFERLGDGPKATHEISEGVRVRCCVNYKDLGVCNGDVFEVVGAVAHSDKTVRLRPLRFDAYAPLAEPIELPAKLLYSFSMGWAFTTHSTIGVTVRGQRLCIYEAEQMLSIDPAILYTAVTRACTVDSVTLSAGIPDCITRAAPAPPAQARQAVIKRFGRPPRT